MYYNNDFFNKQKKAFAYVSDKVANVRSLNPSKRLFLLFAIAITPDAIRLLDYYLDSMANADVSLEYLAARILATAGVSCALATITPGGNDKKKKKDSRPGRLTAGNYKGNDDTYVPTGEQVRLNKGWHKSITEKMHCLTNLDNKLTLDGEYWGMDPAVLTQNHALYVQIEPYYTLYLSGDARNSELVIFRRLLGEDVEYALDVVKPDAIGRCGVGAMDISDLNSLGFLMPNQGKGRHERSGENEIVPETNAKVTAIDTVMVTVDNALDKHGNRTKGSKPKGVKQILIVLQDEKGVEIFNKMFTKTQVYIDIDQKYRGEIILVRAAFLKHVDDTPHFGEPVAVSMPKDIADILQAQEAAKKTND
jgi:hypothetical protein